MRNTAKQPFYGVLKEYEHWVVLFREKQVTIGSVIIMSKHLDQTSLGALPSEAWAQFGEVSKDVEDTLVRAFGAEKFNYLALMMIDPEVHFHVIPRYSKPVYFMEQEFIDPDWPHATERKSLNLPPDVIDAVELHLYQIMNQ